MAQRQLLFASDAWLGNAVLEEDSPSHPLGLPAAMRRVVDSLTEAELDRVCARKPAEPYPEQQYVVRRCLEVLLKEEAEHHRYAVRDLAFLEGP